ncbi:MAG TPA: VCBS repeat-containing protein, partial [Verrucomicrobiae bacterium]|nr:VCBS repeat-containing protein [Verrucomicrobiae bacterium]
VYALREGKWKEITRQLGLDRFVGWWNGVVTGDFDGDGRLDILASNWGCNTKYQRHRDRPLRLYFGDWAGMGRVDMLEAYYEPGLGKYVPFVALDQLRQVCPPLSERFSTFAAYASAGIEEILGKGGRPPIYLEANWFETTLFLNRGMGVEARVLPMEAQLAPAFGLAVGDCDGDGNEDVFLAQNFFDVDAETSRSDAGRGLWLRGDGQGRLRPMAGQESGVILDGEQRGCALCDYNHDGRVDLAVGQNRGPIGLFRNTGGKPGLRVRLRGPAWNPDAIGASIRLRYGERLGPARLVTAGAGYWSQDGLVQVLGRAETPSGIDVRWPGGKMTTRTLGATDQEILLTSP